MSFSLHAAFKIIQKPFSVFVTIKSSIIPPSLLSKKENNDLVSDAGTLLFEQARLMEGKMPADPAQFSKIMNQFLLKAIPN